ncbi:MAG: LLM class F420-dependent oxidoreductase [Proteobacteria bacterium]|nr:LLM class F420-dependent oxidoreductase [Pseudomonadota bacterium]
MRFSAQLPTDRVEQGAEFATGAAIGEMARCVEAAGFDAAYVTEHPFPPDAWLESGGHHALDPFVALSAAAVATERLRLHTNILVLPYRSPFLTAKAVASLDVLSGGRTIVGVAAGYLEGEYAALGGDFEHRNDVTDEAIGAMKQAWRGESVKLSGRGFEVAGNTMRPRPVQEPHPPIWVGGNSKRALRRAALHAEGWSPFPLPAAYTARTRTSALESVAELGERVDALQSAAADAGRGPLDVNFVPFGRGMNEAADLDVDDFCQQLEALAGVGVTWVSVGIPSPSRAGYCEAVARFGEEVIRRLR